MRNILFATVNNVKILGEDIVHMKKRLASENTEHTTFVQIPNDDNQGYLNTEALQQLINIYSLVALAKFEGIDVSDEDISNKIYELRSNYEDDFEWETVLDDLGLNDKNIRNILSNDIIIDRLLLSHMEHLEDPAGSLIEEFYQQNINSMKFPDTYTFIELEIKQPELLKVAVTILSQDNVATITKDAKSYDLEAVLNEDIPFNKLPETLQEIFKDLEEKKIGTIPLEDNSIVLIKLLKKTLGKTLSLEEAFKGISEYLKYQQNADILDQLTTSAVEKCDINYHNTDKLKKLI